MDDQLQLDRQLTEFFAEAKTISLTPDEREFCRFAIESHMMASSVSLTENARHQKHMAHGREPSGSTLDEKEKRQLRKNLVAFMQQNPRYVPDAQVESFSFYRIFELAFPRFALGLLMFVGVGAGVTFASQASVPGDFLYPFKVNVYEPMVSNLATSDTSQAAWEARRAQNRLKEAAKLAAESKLTEEAAAKLRLSFSKHLEKTQENIDILAANGDTEHAASIQTSLETYLESNSSIVRQISVGGGADPSVGIAAAAKEPASSDGKQKGNSSVAHEKALAKKVQTILNAIVGSSSSESSAATVSSSSKAKGEGKAESSSVASSKKSESSKVAESSSKQKESQASSAAAGIDVDVEVDIEADIGTQVSSAATLVPAIFEHIMNATSSAVPPLPNLLP